MIEVTIEAVNVRYNNGEPFIQAQFKAMNHNPTTLAINGSFQLTEEEYDNNRTMKQLAVLIRTKICEKVQETQSTIE